MHAGRVSTALGGGPTIKHLDVATCSSQATAVSRRAHLATTAGIAHLLNIQLMLRSPVWQFAAGLRP